MKARTVLCAGLAILALAAQAACTGASPSAGITISGAWVRSLAAVNTPCAAYMTIMNAGAADERLLSAASDAAATVELHQTDDMNGMLGMSMVPAMAVPARGQLALAPGAGHLMLIGVTRPLQAGDHVTLTLHFEKAGAVTVTADVKDQ